MSTDEISTPLARMLDEAGANTGTVPKAFLVQETETGEIELIFGLHRDSLWNGDFARNARRHCGAVQGNRDEVTAGSRSVLSR